MDDVHRMLGSRIECSSCEEYTQGISVVIGVGRLRCCGSMRADTERRGCEVRDSRVFGFATIGSPSSNAEILKLTARGSNVNIYECTSTKQRTMKDKYKLPHKLSRKFLDIIILRDVH